MSPPHITSLTPLWRTSHFPRTAQLPLQNETTPSLSAENSEHNHCLTRTPAHAGLLTGLAPHLPRSGVPTRPGMAESDAQLQAEMAWLSQVANGRSGAYLLHAQLACAHVKALLTRGSNALHDRQVAAHEIPALHAQAHLKQNALARQAALKGEIATRFFPTAQGQPVPAVSLADYAPYAEPAVRLVGYANCALQTSVAYAYLLRHLPPGTPLDMCEVKGVDHELVVIGRRPGSDPADMDSWGPDAVVCDPWARGAAYPLSQYPDMQRPERDVKRHAGPATSHYLGGRLKVMNGFIPLLD